MSIHQFQNRAIKKKKKNHIIIQLKLRKFCAFKI